MQEEIERETVALVFKAGKFTVETFSNAIHNALEKGLRALPHEKEASGKMSLKELIGKGDKADRIEISRDSLKTFQRVAAKYNVDYAIHKIPEGEESKYYVFFQAKDTATIECAFKEYVAVNEKKTKHKNYRLLSDYDKKNRFDVPRYLMNRGKPKHSEETQVLVVNGD